MAAAVPLIPLIAAGVGLAGQALLGGGSKSPKIEIPKQEPAPVVPKPQQAPPPAGPRQELAELMTDVDRQVAANNAAARRKHGKRASILT